MRKFLLSLAMVVAAISSAYATDVVVDLEAGKYADGTITWAVGEDVTVVQNKGTSSSPVNEKYIAGPRCYKGHYLTFTAAKNVKVTGVEITYDGKYMGNDIVVGTEIADEVVKANSAITANISTENGSTHTFTVAAGVSVMYIQNTGATENVQLRPTAIKVSYEKGEAEAFVQETVTSLDQLSNTQAYIIRDADGEGTVVYNPALSETNLMIAGCTNTSFVPSSQTVKDEYKAEVDLTNANNAWQIVKVEGYYFIYNLGAKKFAANSNKAPYVFTDTPTPMEITANEDGTFGIRTLGTNDQSYMCIAAGNQTAPVAFWTADDHGSILTIETADVSADAGLVNSIKAYMEQEILNEEFAAACDELGQLLSAKTQANATGATPCITDSAQISSPHTETREGSIGALVDGNPNTYWHSSWASAVPAGTHYLEIGFAEELSGFMQLTMTRRSGAADDHLTLASIRGVKDGVETELAVVSMPFAAAGETVNAAFPMLEGQDTIRIYHLASAASDRGYWHAAELQISKVSMPANMEALLLESYGVYNSALSVENATEEQVNTLMAEILRVNVLTGAAIEAGTYLIAADIEGQLRAAVALPEDKSYGYPAAVDATLADGKVTTEDEPQPFTFVATDGGFLMKDVFGRYVYLSKNYNSINVSTDVPTEGAVWTVTTNEDGTVNIYNNDKKKVMQYSTNYNNYGFYATVSGPLPVLYSEYGKDGVDTGIDEVNTGANEADGVAFTLQGFKATKNTRGIIIRSGKKVMVK